MVDDSSVNLPAELDTEIGQELFVKLNRLTERLAKRHGLSVERAVDFLLAGSLFTAANIHELSIDEVVEMVKEIARSVQEDELAPAVRH